MKEKHLQILREIQSDLFEARFPSNVRGGKRLPKKRIIDLCHDRIRGVVEEIEKEKEEREKNKTEFLILQKKI